MLEKNQNSLDVDQFPLELLHPGLQAGDGQFHFKGVGRHGFHEDLRVPAARSRIGCAASADMPVIDNYPGRQNVTNQGAERSVMG